MKFHICPQTENCVIYKNYAEFYDDRIDIIVESGNNYYCHALDALQDNDVGGIPKNNELESRIKTKDNDFNCLNILLLNK